MWVNPKIAKDTLKLIVKEYNQKFHTSIDPDNYITHRLFWDYVPTSQYCNKEILITYKNIFDEKIVLKHYNFKKNNEYDLAADFLFSLNGKQINPQEIINYLYNSGNIWITPIDVYQCAINNKSIIDIKKTTYSIPLRKTIYFTPEQIKNLINQNLIDRHTIDNIIIPDNILNSNIEYFYHLDIHHFTAVTYEYMKALIGDYNQIPKFIKEEHSSLFDSYTTNMDYLCHNNYIPDELLEIYIHNIKELFQKSPSLPISYFRHKEIPNYIHGLLGNSNNYAILRYQKYTVEWFNKYVKDKSKINFDNYLTPDELYYNNEAHKYMLTNASELYENIITQKNKNILINIYYDYMFNDIEIINELNRLTTRNIFINFDFNNFAIKDNIIVSPDEFYLINKKLNFDSI